MHDRSCHLKLLTLENRPRLLALPPRNTLLTRIRELIHTLRLHLHTVPGLRRCDIVPVLDPRGVKEVFMEMVDVFQDALLAGHDNIVDCAQMLCVLGQTDTAGVRDDGDAEFRGHEQHGDDFVDAAEPTRVDLADVDGSGL